MKKPQWFLGRNHKGQTGVVSVHWSYEMGNFTEIWAGVCAQHLHQWCGSGGGGHMVMASGDTELLGKANGTKPQRELGMLGDKMTDEILWRQM